MQFQIQKSPLVSRSKFNLVHRESAFLFGNSLKSHVRWLTKRLSIWYPIIWRPLPKVMGLLLMLLGILQAVSWITHGRYFAQFPDIQWHWYMIAFLAIGLGSTLEHIYQLRRAYSKRLPVVEKL